MAAEWESGSDFPVSITAYIIYSVEGNLGQKHFSNINNVLHKQPKTEKKNNIETLNNKLTCILKSTNWPINC